MKSTIFLKKTAALVFGFQLSVLSVFSQNATEIVRKAENLLKGEKTSYSEMQMQIVRPKYTRTLEFKSWGETDGNSMTLITAPAKEKGQSFMKMGNNMWSWNPAIQRLIKMPPSMMSQGWMGSDFSNDDVLKESSLVKDFTHKLIGKETVSGLECYKIELTPLTDADIVWGKVLIWIDAKNSFEMKIQFFDEENELVKTHTSSEIKTFDGRLLPAVLEIVPADNPQNKTVVTIKAMKFNIEIAKNFFTQQNMKTIK
ncbi:MAG: outer membrane lipoprotein-sorting protein [Prevotellaceae bacterium]|jgi:outer membrane lipoprotein-sorting protein|nr:outer membrane lipoprotein-sorting protein [Prevotellaceae bacterium]